MEIRLSMVCSKQGIILCFWLLVSSLLCGSCTTSVAPVVEDVPVAEEEEEVLAEYMLPEGDWQLYRDWQQQTGFFSSPVHGEVTARVFVTPEQVATVYARNRELYRSGYRRFKPYPLGSIILLESFFKIESSGKKEAGPVFIMQKHGKSNQYRPNGWEFIKLDKPSGQVIARDKHIAINACRSCHGEASQRDYVYFYKK